MIKLGINKKTGEKVAIKVLKKKEMKNSDLEMVKTEIEILKVCQHPNIIRMFEVFESKENFYLVMELCLGGDLFSYMRRRANCISEERAREIIYDILKAVSYLHEYGIAHRDLKPENILITSNKDNAELKIADFGLGKILGPNGKCSDCFGTLVFIL